MTLLGRAVLPHSVPTATDSTIYGGPLLSDPYVLDRVFPALVAASKVIVTANPTGVTPNVPFSLTVNAVDASNVLAAGYSGSATVTKTSGPGTLSGTLTASFVAGVLTFTNLLLDTAGSYTLTISSGSLTPGTTSSFTVAIIVYAADAFNHGSFGVADTGQTWAADTGTFTDNGTQAVSTATAQATLDATHANARVLVDLASGVEGGIVARKDATNKHVWTANQNGSGYSGYYPTISGTTNTNYPRQQYGTNAATIGIAANAARLAFLRKSSGASTLTRVGALTAATGQANTRWGIYETGAGNFDNFSVDSDISTVPIVSGTPPFVLFLGNSLVQCNGVTDDSLRWPEIVMNAAPLGYGYDFWNSGLGGQTTTQMQVGGTIANQVTAFYNAGQPYRIAVVWEIGNDIAVGGVAAATAVTNYINYCTTLKNAGWIVIAMTLSARSDISTANANIVTSGLTGASTPPWTQLVRIDQDANIGTGANTSSSTYYFDGVHLKAPGYAIVANLVKTAITNILAVAGIPAKLAFTTQPGGAASGVNLSPQPVIVVQDALGLTCPADTSSVTVALVGGGATLNGTLTVAAVAGVVTFAGLNISANGTYTLHATDGSLTAADSGNITITSPAVVSDDFTRTDNATSMGNADTGQTWNVSQAGEVAGILSNQAYISTPSGNQYAWIDAGAGHADGTVSVVVPTVTSGNVLGLHFRSTDTNLGVQNTWRYVYVSGTLYLQKFVSGSMTTVQSTAFTLNDGDSLKVITSGSTIQCYAGPAASMTHVTALDTTDSFNSTATKYGIFAANAAVRFATFRVTGGAGGATLSLSPTTWDPTATVGGSTVSQTVTVTASGSWTATTSSTGVSLTGASGTGNGSFTAIYTPAGSAGTSAVDVAVAETGATTQHVTGTATTNAATATHLSFSQQPIATGKTIAFTAPPKVQALLAGGGVDTSYVANVTIGITSGSGGTAGAGATLSGTATVAAVAGVADFTSAGLNLNQGGTAYQLHASSGALTAADSSAFDVAAVYDQYTHADTVSTLPTAPTGQTYTVAAAAVFHVASNTAATDGTNGGWATIDGGSANGKYKVTLLTGTSGNCGTFRFSDLNNHWMVRLNGGSVQLFKMVTGGYTMAGSASGGSAGSVIEADLSGSSITIFVDGVSLITVTDSFNSTATSYGLNVLAGAAVAWDDMSFVPA